MAAETFYYLTFVTAESQEQADQVMAERLQPDEDYGFDYAVDYVKYEGEVVR